MGWNAGAPEDVWPATPEDLDDATMMPVLRKPEHLLLTVAGGLQATFCACIQGWGYMAAGPRVVLSGRTRRPSLCGTAVFCPFHYP